MNIELEPRGTQMLLRPVTLKSRVSLFIPNGSGDSKEPEARVFQVLATSEDEVRSMGGEVVPHREFAIGEYIVTRRAGEFMLAGKNVWTCQENDVVMSIRGDVEEEDPNTVSALELVGNASEEKPN